MRKGTGDLLGIRQVDHFIGSVGVRLRTTHAESYDLSLRIQFLQLLQERNGATLAVGACWLAVKEVEAGLVNGLLDQNIQNVACPLLYASGSLIFSYFSFKLVFLILVYICITYINYLFLKFNYFIFLNHLF